jgi:hypothetical protein
LQVKHLSLHFNALSSLPAGIGGAGSLVWLSLNANRLTELPAEICKLTGLQRLSLHINQVMTCLWHGASLDGVGVVERKYPLQEKSPEYRMFGFTALPVLTV